MLSFRHKFSVTILCVLALMPWLVSNAAPPTLAMHAEPNAHSKVIGHFKDHATINVVDSGWVYVFNAKTLKAGWVERTALQHFMAQHSGSRMVKQTLHVYPDGSHTQFYTHVGHLDGDQMDRALKQERARQKKWLQDMSRTMRQLEHMANTWLDVGL